MLFLYDNILSLSYTLVSTKCSIIKKASYLEWSFADFLIHEQLINF